MIRRRRLKVQWFLSILLTLLVSGTLLYKNIENESNPEASLSFSGPRKALLSIETTPNTSVSTETYFKTSSTENLNGKHVTKSMTQLGKMDEISKHFLFLNSVPKSGSEILIFLLEKIQGFNTFKHIRLTGGQKKKMMTQIEQENLIYEIYGIRRDLAIPLSFDRSVYFINFTAFDKQSPTYINLIRNPVEKVMVRAISPKTGRYDNHFIECITDSSKNCSFKTGQPYDLTIPYFCGQDPRCMLLNNEWALETAKKNVDQYYPVIGVLEELNTTVDVLEQKLPQFFKGAKLAYEQNLLEVYKHKKEPEIPENIKEILDQTLTMELDFYGWVKDRLFEQVNLQTESSIIPE